MEDYPQVVHICKNRIRVNGVLSDSCIIHGGVKQGSLLSPLLFVLLLDDLLKTLRKNKAGLTIRGNFCGWCSSCR